MDKGIKEHVAELLKKRDFGILLGLFEKDRQYWQEVRYRLYDLDEKLRWSAIETVARFMQLRWQSGQEEKVRVYIRTLFWSMTDESGGIGWSAPHTIAEIIALIPELIDPYGSMMIAYSIDEPPLVKGCLWGIGRVGRSMSVSVGFFKDKVLNVFRSDDKEILGLAGWAMGETRFTPALPLLKRIRTSTEPVRIYINGDFLELTLREWVEEAIGRIQQSGKDE